MAGDEEYRELEEEREEEAVGFNFSVGVWNELIGEDIQYKVLTPGHGRIAEVHMLIRCKFIGRLQSTGQVFEVAEDTGYRIGDNDTTPALELGLRHMRKGEKGIVRCAAKYGFGPPGRPMVAPGAEVAVPENAMLEYEIEVVDVLPPFNPKDAPLLARVGEAELKKRHGNGFFHHLDFNRAIRCYQAGLKALDAESVDEEEEEERVYAAMVKKFCDVSNNLAAALMKLERWKDAKEVCVKVIEVDKDNVKALFRGGLAALRQDNFEEAELALREAAKLAPNDPVIRAAVEDLQRKRAEYIAKEKKMMKKMGGFLMTPEATGISEEEVEKEGSKGKRDEQVEKEGEDAVVADTTSTAAAAEKEPEEEEEEEEDGDEEEEEQPIKLPVAASAATAGAVSQQEQMEARPINPWLAWYIEHYDWFVTAAFLILPVLFIGGDLKASWARWMGGGGGGGGRTAREQGVSSSQRRRGGNGGDLRRSKWIRNGEGERGKRGGKE